MPVEPLRIEGLREFQASLRKMDGESQKKLRLVLNSAAELVVSGATSMVPVRSGRAKSSIRAGSTQREARVKGGGARTPYYPWLDFGGAVGRRNSVRRPFFKRGRYIYPAYEDAHDKIIDNLAEALVRLIKDSGLDPH